MSSQEENIKACFKRAHHQMLSGCGNLFCLNPHCRPNLTQDTNPAKIAARLLEMMKLIPGNDLSLSKDLIFCEPAKLVLKASDSFENISENEIIALFSDPRSLGSSFKDETRKVNWQSVTKFYARANSLTQAGALHSDWMNQCLSNFYQSDYSKLFISSSLCVALASPSLSEIEQMPIIEIIYRLCNDSVAKELSRLMDFYPAELIHQICAYLHQFIAIEIIQSSEVNKVDSTLPALNLLQCLYQSNERFNRISFKEFYNDAINSEDTNFDSEFKSWYLYYYRVVQKKEKDVPKSSFFCFPWIFNADSKSKILALEIKQIMYNEIKATIRRDFDMNIFVILQVNRDNLIEDTLTQLTSGDLNLRKPLKVHFIGEEGIDEGGVKKEFFQLIVKELFDPNFAMFNYYESQRFYWFNPDTIDTGINFELIGKILGLAIYNSIILDVHLPMVTYKKILGRKTGIKDLEEFDPELVRGLQQLLEFEGNVEEVFCKSFHLETLAFGEVVKHELKPNGESIPVTNENREEYVDLFVDWWLNKGVERIFSEFKNGFLSVCGGEVLGFFKPEELELMVCGNPVLDFKELQKVTRYENYTAKSLTVRFIQVVYFWDIIHSFSEEQKRKFLCFVTGSDRAPINGLGHMDLIISRTGAETNRLMTAHTCFNYLLLPEYKDKENMRKLMITAIENSAGFGLR